jgi:glycosyltransferase involved in cell wall biosynthesis
MPSLADALMTTGQVKLGIATNVSGHSLSEKRINNKTYFSIPVQHNRVKYNDLPLPLVQNYQRVVDGFKPDIIHIHGTEYFHGLLTGRKYIECPTVISIQGILDIYKEHYFGGISLFDLIRTRTLRDWVRFDGLLEQKLKIYRRARWEREIFASNNAFIGRTQWDKACTYMMNPTAQYYHCAEMLRSIFYETSWKLDDINRHTIYASSASSPIKGFHVLLKAVSILRRDFHDIQLRVPLAGVYHTFSGLQYFWKSMRSGGYARYLTELIEQEGLEKHVSSLGVIDAAKVADELRKAHVFILPSFNENSPNSLAEAMLVGTPSVVSYTGGVPSMVNDGESALCFPFGDEALLADQIRRIFLQDELANKLSGQSRSVAQKRHLKETITSDMLAIYHKEIVRQTNANAK